MKKKTKKKIENIEKRLKKINSQQAVGDKQLSQRKKKELINGKVSDSRAWNLRV